MAVKHATLKAWMDASGVNQPVLAGLLGVKQSFISKLVYRKKNPSLTLAVRIHKYTGVPYEGLLAEPQKENSNGQ